MARNPALIDRHLAPALRGGYPEVVARRDLERRRAWFRSYVTTILQRDVRDLARIARLTDLPRLVSVLAARSAFLPNEVDIVLEAEDGRLVGIEVKAEATECPADMSGLETLREICR